MPQARPSQTPAWNKLRLFMHLYGNVEYGPCLQLQNRRKRFSWTRAHLPFSRKCMKNRSSYAP